MLADRAPTALVDNFASQWLRLQNVKEARSRRRPCSRTSRATSAQSMTRETQLLFDSIVREDRSRRSTC